MPASTLLTTFRQRGVARSGDSGRRDDVRSPPDGRSGTGSIWCSDAFAGVAVLLASIGVFGAVAYAVQARTREFGVRLAFGAMPSQLIRSALWQAGRIAVVGGAVGLGVTLILARVIGNALYLVPRAHNGLLYGVTTTDPAMLAGAFGGIVLVALLAGAVPARRVAGVDPVRALRAE